MTEETEVRGGDIFKLLPQVAAEIGAVGKTGHNDFHNYDFRSVDMVVDTSHPAFVKFGVTPIPEVIDVKREIYQREGKTSTMITLLTVRYKFYAPDGSFVSAVVVGEGGDTGDKSCNKALSAAYKYCLGQVFTIPFGMDDSEKDSPAVGGPAQSAPQSSGKANSGKAGGAGRGTTAPKAKNEPEGDFYGKLLNVLADNWPETEWDGIVDKHGSFEGEKGGTVKATLDRLSRKPSWAKSVYHKVKKAAEDIRNAEVSTSSEGIDDGDFPPEELE